MGPTVCGILSVLVAACEVQPAGPASPDRPGAVVVGWVVHEATGVGLTRARVELPGGGTALTDGDGFYSVHHVRGAPPPALVTITARAEGFVPAAAIVAAGERVVHAPTLRLTPHGTPIDVGPAGVSALVAGGVRVDIPARAARKPTRIRVTPLIGRTIYDPRIPDELRMAVGIYFDPGDLEPFERVAFSIPLAHPGAPGQHLPVRRLHPQSANWDSVSTAIVASGGRSAVLVAAASGGQETLWISENRKITFHLAVALLVPGNIEAGGTRVQLAFCAWGPRTFPSITQTVSRNLVLPTFPTSMLPLKTELESRIGTTQAVVRPEYRIGARQRRTLEVWLEYDNYDGLLSADGWDLDAQGTWVVNGSVSGRVRYRYWEWNHSWSCHAQGQGQ